MKELKPISLGLEHQVANYSANLGAAGESFSGAQNY
jgi:hypothetical protein